MDIEAIKQAKANSSKNYSKSDEKFESLYQKVFEQFLEIMETGHHENFRKVSENFAKLIELKPSRPEPFFFLGFIFYITGNSEGALDFLYQAQELDSDFIEVEYLIQEIEGAL